MSSVVMGADANSPPDAFGHNLLDVAALEPVPDTPALESKLTMIAFNKDCPLKDALNVLAANYQKNIVPSSRVEGFLGFSRLRNVTFEEAMDAVLGNNFVYEEKGRIIKVYSREEYRKIKADVDRMVYRVFTLYYMSAFEALNLIGPVLSGAGMVKASTPAEVAVPTGESISNGASGGDSLASNDKIIVWDYPEKIAKIEEFLKVLDVRPRQVLVEATIMSVRLDEDTKLGVDWNIRIDGVSPALLPGAMTSGFSEVVGGVKGLSIGITQDHARVFIRALEKVSDITVLANPKILAVNKQLGQVFIGKKIGYKSGNTVGVGGVVTEGEVKFLETGTKLSFRPYIGNDGYIRMDIHPKDSTGQLNSQGVPEETSAELATNIIVKDGQTVVIGGMFRTVLSIRRNQVPVLGNLPLIGPLFRSTDDQEVREEVIVLLTPHILGELDVEEGRRAQDDVDRKYHASKDAIVPIAASKLAQTSYEKACRFYLEGNRESALRHVDISLAIRPAYLEAIRLRERILAETDPHEFERLDRIVAEKIDALEDVSGGSGKR
ncbi:MAG: hypothetical protein O7G83_22050 [Proteobacteria bacterium]|nr:hypothetical protein [Pseudomonadota bacterium]